MKLVESSDELSELFKLVIKAQKVKKKVEMQYRLNNKVSHTHHTVNYKVLYEEL